jgi:hypothetical protein
MFNHNCSHCKSLGSYTTPNGNLYTHLHTFDLYVCNDSLLARYGNEPHEYASILISIINRYPSDKLGDDPLFEALSRYKKET